MGASGCAKLCGCALVLRYNQFCPRVRGKRGTRIITHTVHDVGIPNQIGSYSDAIEAKPDFRWLMTSGTPGLSVGGDLPKDITGQADLRGNM